MCCLATGTNNRLLINRSGFRGKHRNQQQRLFWTYYHEHCCLTGTDNTDAFSRRRWGGQVFTKPRSHMRSGGVPPLNTNLGNHTEVCDKLHGPDDSHLTHIGQVAHCTAKPVWTLPRTQKSLQRRRLLGRNAVYFGDTYSFHHFTACFY
jgi:hypothetical protein